MKTILDKIVASKLGDIAARKETVSKSELLRRIDSAPRPLDFLAALRTGPSIKLIAEVKRASPSVGVIRSDFDPVAIARTYAAHGAAAISVLTDGPFFQGSLDDLSAIRPRVSVPLLRKDFIIDAYQLLEARAAGADAVLLIAEILHGPALPPLLRTAESLGMHCLVELYDAENLPRVIDSGARIIGINNRDLRTFETRLEHTLDLCQRVPKDRCLVSESGIRQRADVERLSSAGIHAILIGETLMRSPDAGSKLDELMGRSRQR